MLRSRRKPHAFTLVEALIASAILAFVVTAVTQAIGSAQSNSYEALIELRGLSLANSLMEEIVSKPYADPEDPDGEADRDDFDDIDDYDDYQDLPDTLAGDDGALYPDTYQSYTRVVSVATETQSISGLGSATSGLSVIVTVTDSRGLTWELDRFIPEPAP